MKPEIKREKGSRQQVKAGWRVEEAKWRRLKEEKRASRSTELSLFQEIARLSVNSPGVSGQEEQSCCCWILGSISTVISVFRPP